MNRHLRTEVNAPAGIPEADGRARALRIVHVLASINPATGGPATVVARMAAAQAARGHRVAIISSLSSDTRQAFEQSTAKIPGFDRVHLLINSWTSAASRWFGLRLNPLYHTLFPFTDVLHVHGVWEPMLLFAASLARKMKIPYIVRPCGMLDPWNLNHRGWKKKIALAVSHRKMLDRAAFIHTLNQDEYRLMAPLRLRPAQLIIPNAVFLNEVDDASGESTFATQFPQLQGKPYILFLGRLHYKKGLDVLAESFARIAVKHPALQLLVVGPDGGSRTEFLDIIARHKLTDRVHLPGPLYGAVKFAAYRNAACFCLPSRQEGFSLSITEALACRTPVAISENCHFPEVAEAGAGTVTPLNVDATAESLDRILSTSTERREHMGTAGRELVENNFTWDRVAELTLRAYASIVPEKSRDVR